MLLNFWSTDCDPTNESDWEPLRTTWKSMVRQARIDAFDGRFSEAQKQLVNLKGELQRHRRHDLSEAVDLELVRLPKQLGRGPEVNALKNFRDTLQKNTSHTPTQVCLLALASSELDLIQFQRRLSPEKDRTPAQLHRRIQRERGFKRIEAISELGRFHPTVGILNLHLGMISQGLGDTDRALDYLTEASACFTGEWTGGFGPPEQIALQFTHERSEVLMYLAEVAVDVGFLDQAEHLLIQAMYLKDCQPEFTPRFPKETAPRPGIPLFYQGLRVTDRLGLARCYTIQGKLFFYQGRFVETLEASTSSQRLVGKGQDRGFYVNRVAQVMLEEGAFRMAQEVYRKNIQRATNEGKARSLNGAIARLGLARTELIRTIPTGPDVVQGPQHAQLRRQARGIARSILAQAGEDLRMLERQLHLTPQQRASQDVEASLTGTPPSDPGSPNQRWFASLNALNLLCEGHQLLDQGTLDSARFSQIRQTLHEVAQRNQVLWPTDVGDILWDLVRLEVWAWRAHGYTPLDEVGEQDRTTFDRLLDLWERRGARGRLERLHEWAENVGLGDVSRILLLRYLPQATRDQEVVPSKTMTILFADLRDSCGHGVEAGVPEDIARLEADLFRAINPVIQDHHGMILRYQGDSILVVFGLNDTPSSATQDPAASNAIDCALAMQRAVQRLNVLRQAQVSRRRPLQLPVGIHTGEASAAHLLIPGRREITVFGNAVNLAKRIQETPRVCPETFECGPGTLLDPFDDLILVSKATLDCVIQGTFRSFLIAKQIRFKGYPDQPHDVYRIRPTLPVRCSFIGVGSTLHSQPGILAMDVGNNATVGVIDHHQPGVVGCATSLALEHPDWIANAAIQQTHPNATSTGGANGGTSWWSSLEEPASTSGLPRPKDRLFEARPAPLSSRSCANGRVPEIVLHAEPDFDCCAAAFLALEHFEGRYPTHPSSGARANPQDRRHAALSALANYAHQIDAGLVLPSTLARSKEPNEEPAQGEQLLRKFACSPYALLAGSSQMPEDQDQSPWASFDLPKDVRRLERGIQVIHAAVECYQGLPEGTSFAEAFREGVPPALSRQAEWVKQDSNTYQDKDSQKITKRKYWVPHTISNKRVPQRCAIITDPTSELFKVWAREAGYTMLVVDTCKGFLTTASGERVPLRRHVISVLPDSRLTLAELGQQLEHKEDRRRRQWIEEKQVHELERGGPPRPGFPNSDPWYDGRSVVLAYTIVDAPRQGSVLSLDEVLQTLDELYGASPEDSDH